MNEFSSTRSSNRKENWKKNQMNTINPINPIQSTNPRWTIAITPFPTDRLCVPDGLVKIQTKWCRYTYHRRSPSSDWNEPKSQTLMKTCWKCLIVSNSGWRCFQKSSPILTQHVDDRRRKCRTSKMLMLIVLLTFGWAEVVLFYVNVISYLQFSKKRCKMTRNFFSSGRNVWMKCWLPKKRGFGT